MQAGSGGIRYNDSEKYIQLMDENKNWVNWKYFNASLSQLELVWVSNGSGTQTFNLPYTGNYVLYSAKHETGNYNFSIEGQTYYNMMYQFDSYRYAFVNIFHANAGVTGTFYIGASSYSRHSVLVYIPYQFDSISVITEAKGTVTTPNLTAEISNSERVLGIMIAASDSTNATPCSYSLPEVDSTVNTNIQTNAPYGTSICTYTEGFVSSGQFKARTNGTGFAFAGAYRLN